MGRFRGGYDSIKRIRKGGDMTTAVPLTEEERGRVVRMTVDVLDLIMAEASRRDGVTDNEANVRLLERRKEAENRLDVGLALDIADRLGEDVLRKAMEEYTPPSVRASLDALMKREGGTKTLLVAPSGQLPS
jgi:hypothetical protein